jgi:hypothetical protein
LETAAATTTNAEQYGRAKPRKRTRERYTNSAPCTYHYCICEIDVQAYLEKTLKERIMFIDGAMGTMIQRLRLTEEDFRGNVFEYFFLWGKKRLDSV